MATEKQKRAVKDWKEKYPLFRGSALTFIYLIKCNEYYKIGIAFDIDSRLISLQCGNPYELELLWVARLPSDQAKDIEHMMHQYFESKHHFLEWYKLTDEDVATITVEVP